jgi:hypothetical protein
MKTFPVSFSYSIWKSLGKVKASLLLHIIYTINVWFFIFWLFMYRSFPVRVLLTVSSSDIATHFFSHNFLFSKQKKKTNRSGATHLFYGAGFRCREKNGHFIFLFFCCRRQLLVALMGEKIKERITKHVSKLPRSLIDFAFRTKTDDQDGGLSIKNEQHCCLKMHHSFVVMLMHFKSQHCVKFYAEQNTKNTVKRAWKIFEKL